jgi:hypothetical protein
MVKVRLAKVFGMSKFSSLVTFDRHVIRAMHAPYRIALVRLEWFELNGRNSRLLPRFS